MYTELVQGIGWMFGVIVLMGGLIGYLQAGSLASLYAGIGSGCVALVGGLLVAKSDRYTNVGLKILLCVSIALVYVFQQRIRETGFKFMPSGFMIINSLAILALSALALKERSSKHKNN